MLRNVVLGAVAVGVAALALVEVWHELRSLNRKGARAVDAWWDKLERHEQRRLTEAEIEAVARRMAHHPLH